MSKLVDRLEILAEGRGQPLGFGAALNREKALPMLAVASLPSPSAELANAATGAGADAVLFEVENWQKEKQALSELSSTAKAGPWGVHMRAPTVEIIKELAAMKCDFAVFTADKTPAALLVQDELTRIIQMSPSLDDSLAKAVGRLGFDAVLLAPDKGEEYPLTLQRLLVYERLAAAAGRHVLAIVPESMPLDDLGALWVLGARGLVIEAPPGKMESRLAEVREAIAKLPTKRRKPRDRFGVTLPHAAASSHAAPPDEDDEEDDDD